MALGENEHTVRSEYFEYFVYHIPSEMDVSGPYMTLASARRNLTRLQSYLDNTISMNVPVWDMYGWFKRYHQISDAPKSEFEIRQVKTVRTYEGTFAPQRRR